MNHPYLSVDKDIEVYMRENAGWNRRGIDSLRVEGMGEALDVLSHRAVFFVAINADNICYLPMLSVMRDATSAPIFIITSSFTIAGQVEALHAGADAYAPFQSTTEDNILSALALLHRYSEQRKQSPKKLEYLSSGKLFLFLDLWQVFCNDVEVILTKTEFDILHLFMSSRRKVQTFAFIYEHVWGETYTIASKKTVTNHVISLRQKIAAISGTAKCIQNVRGVGYKFMPLDNI